MDPQGRHPGSVGSLPEQRLVIEPMVDTSYMIPIVYRYIDSYSAVFLLYI